METERDRRGFALILTISLLALLVLATYGLGVLSRVGSQTAISAARQTVARQNALTALSLGLGELQRSAGDDSRITGMAGVAGVAASATSTTRYWCGVWQSDGTFVAWLTSGATGSAAVAGEPIELISAGSVGAASSTSANVEKEHVIAGKIPITLTDPSTGRTAVLGNCAFVVVDEGVKISAYSPPGERPDPSLAPAISGTMLTNQLKLKSALDAYAAKLPAVISYEQLALLPTPSAALTPSVLQDTFHYVSLTTRSVMGNQLAAGTVNINTSSTLVWRCLLDLYN